ncbi:MAG: insulinase family protein [Acidobacteria bacterium]|nr:insulinase family protein [Acidobacteriota bacterium]
MSGLDRSRPPTVVGDPVFTFPRIERHTLANGLQVRTVEHMTVPVVTMVLDVEGGSLADPHGREGLAALTADMVDEGVGELSTIDISDAMARIGADYSADVGSDTTRFTLTTLTRFADRGASLLADLLMRPSMRHSDFDRVRQLRLDRLQQLKDSPAGVAERAFLRLMYAEHPYGHLSIGTAAALGSVTLEEVVAFHVATFQPAHSTLVVVGPLSHEGLLGIAQKAFSGWSGFAPLVHTPASVVPHSPPRLAIVPRPGAAQSQLRIGHLSATRNTPDYRALLVMNAVLGGQFVSRINLKLREEKGYTYGARTGFDWHRGLSPFSLETSVHTAATADAIADCLTEFGAISGPKPPTSDELAMAKASLTKGYPRAFETAEQVARSVGQLALYGLPDSYFEDFIPGVNAIGQEDVVDVAARYVDPSRAVTLIVGDYQAIEASLAPLGLGAPQILPVE